MEGEDQGGAGAAQAQASVRSELPGGQQRLSAADLSALEAVLLQHRRQAAGLDPDEREGPRIGLALSGGGIRSATFCLGLMRGLARNGVLKRFDYLSTVSGGGYVGAMWTRLVSALGVDEAQRVLAREDSLPLAWLRRYGRYLMPRGARDYGIAVATYLRAALAVHLELAFLALLLAAVVVLPHVLQRTGWLFDPQDWSGWQSVWWPLAAAWWLLAAPGNLTAYWMLRDEPGGANGLARVGFGDAVVVGAALVGAGAIAWCLRATVGPLEAWLPFRGPTAGLIGFAVFASIGLRGLWLLLRVATARESRSLSNARLRKRMTAQLRAINLGLLALTAIGLFDLASWTLMNLLRSDLGWLFGGFGLGGVLVLVVRNFEEPLRQLGETGSQPRPGLVPRLLNLAGLGVAALLVLLWMTLAQWWVFVQGGADASVGLVERWLWLAAVPLAWCVVTWCHVGTVNASSLHNFYRARLTRAYLAVGNPRRFSARDLRGDSAAQEGPVNPEHLSDVTEVFEGDDLWLRDHRPEQRGGPIHLINVCLNQTRGGASGLYNADRKGVPLVASARGLEVGADGALLPERECGLDTLGRWVAISGAAASPGAGAYTTRGWALLLFLGGARLGYWFERARLGERWLARKLRRSKLRRLFAEAAAAFHGPDAPLWYLSDGGHFDNTGVHALLRRELDFIVLADCGGDPDYAFADVENLVRKARIDYGAQIEFYHRQSADRLPLPPGGALGIHAPESLRDAHSERGVLLARIRYRARDGRPGKVGSLLVVKPNLHKRLDSDVLAYARRNPEFPQQSTADQFFDEAQWESYHRLGEDIGRSLKRPWLQALPGWSAPAADGEDDELAGKPVRPPNQDSKPFWLAGGKAAAIGATLGFGAIATLLVPAMEVGRQLREQRAQRERSMATLAAELDQRLQPILKRGLVGAGTVDDALRSQVIELYQRVRRERRDPAGARQAVTVIDALQRACGLDEGERIGRACPPELSLEQRLCSAVCDPAGVANHRYWAVDALAASLAVATEPEEFSAAIAQTPAPASPHDRSAAPEVRVPTDPPAGAGKPVDGQNAMIGSIPAEVIASEQTVVEAEPSPGERVLRACGAAEVRAGAEPGGALRLYVQIHDETLRAAVAQAPWDEIRGRVDMLGIENVRRTANARGTAAPKPYPQPTLVVHRLQDVGADCVQALGAWVGLQAGHGQWYGKADPPVEVRELPPRLRGDPRVLELWLPSRLESPARAR